MLTLLKRTCEVKVFSLYFFFSRPLFLLVNPFVQVWSPFLAASSYVP